MSAAQLKGAAKNLPPGGLIGVCWAGVGVAAFFVSARVYARIDEINRIGWDEYWILVALLFLAVNAILQTLQTESLYYLVYASAGRVPLGESLKAQGNVYVRYEFVIIGFFWTVLWCVKASFLALYWRLFDGFSQWRRIWWFVAAFTFLSYAGAWFASGFNCDPAGDYFNFGTKDKLWTSKISLNCSDDQGTCGTAADARRATITIIYTTTVDIMSDVMIMLLPLNMLSKLQVNRRQKFALGAIFSVGLIIVVVAIIRAIEIAHQERTDPVALAVWGLVESTVSVIVGSLPPLKALLSRRGSGYPSSHAYGHSYAIKPRSGTFRNASNGATTPSTRQAAVRLHSLSHDDERDLYTMKDNHISVQGEYDVKYGSQEDLKP